MLNLRHRDEEKPREVSLNQRDKESSQRPRHEYGDEKTPRGVNLNHQNEERLQRLHLKHKEKKRLRRLDLDLRKDQRLCLDFRDKARLHFLSLNSKNKE